MAKARYKNPWHAANDPKSYGPEYYETSEKPVEHAGHLIYERIDGSVWDVVKDGVCVSQMAGINGAKNAAEQAAKWTETYGYKVGDVVTLAVDYEATMLSRIRAGKNQPGDLSITEASKMASAEGVVSQIFPRGERASVRFGHKTVSLHGDCLSQKDAAPHAKPAGLSL